MFNVNRSKKLQGFLFHFFFLWRRRQWEKICKLCFYFLLFWDFFLPSSLPLHKREQNWMKEKTQSKKFQFSEISKLLLPPNLNYSKCLWNTTKPWQRQGDMLSITNIIEVLRKRLSPKVNLRIVYAQ